MSDVSTYDQLADRVIDVACWSALSYCRKYKQYPPAQVLIDAIRRHVADSLDKAIDDAGAAYSCGMDSVAQGTFTLSIRLAGIAAAKECLGETWERDNAN